MALSGLSDYQVNCLWVQKKRCKTDYQDSCKVGTILGLFYLQITCYFLPSLESIGISVQEERKTDFQDGSHGGHLGFPIRMILPILIY